MKKIFYWFLRIVPVIIMLQTLFYKFTGAFESIAIFSELSIEPFGRIGSGIIELIASILLLIPAKSLYGALLGAGTMFGAIVSHLLILGIERNNDGGILFMLAIITFICCVLIIFTERNKFITLKKQIKVC